MEGGAGRGRGRGRVRGGHGPVPGRRYELDGAVGRLHHQIVIVMDPEPESESRSQLEPHGSIFGSARAASPPIRTFGV